MQREMRQKSINQPHNITALQISAPCTLRFVFKSIINIYGMLRCTFVQLPIIDQLIKMFGHIFLSLLWFMDSDNQNLRYPIKKLLSFSPYKALVNCNLGIQWQPGNKQGHWLFSIQNLLL